MAVEILNNEVMDVDQNDPDPLQKLYKGLNEDGLYTKSFDEFKAKYSTPKAVEQLYKGLSEDGMYTKSKNDFVKQYFPKIGGMETPTEVPQPTPGAETPSQPPKEEDVMALGKARKRLKEDMGNYAGTGLEEQKEAELKAIDERIKKSGFDPDVAEREFSDMPKISGFSAKQALELKEQNPQLYDRKKAAIKSQYALMQAVNKKDGPDAAKAFIDGYVAEQFAPDYEGQRQATRNAIAAVHKFVDSSAEQAKIIGDLVADKGYGYGVGLPGQEEAIATDPRSENLNPYQVTALQFLEDVDPASATSFNRLLSFSPDEVMANSSNTSFMRGYEAKARDLENIGMSLMRKSLEEKMTSMLPSKDAWSEAEKAEYASLYERYDSLAKDQAAQDQRYPAMAVLDADQQMQDAMQQSKRGVVAKTVLGIGENVDDAANWLYSLVANPLKSDQQEVADDLTLLGDKRLSATNQYETEKEELFSRAYKTVFTGNLKSEIDRIKTDAALTDEEKQQAITKAILSDNRKNIQFIANDNSGKKNITGKTVLNAVSNVVSEVAPSIALAYLTGGGATASKVKELTTLFGSTFATAYRDNYNTALEKNMPNPTSYATTHTMIEAASELLGNDLSMAKKIFSGKAAGEMLANATRKEVSAALKGGSAFAKIKDALIATGKGATKNALTEAYEEMAGAAVSNIADKTLFNEDVDLSNDVMESGVSAFIGMLPLGLLGLPSNYNQINKVQQYAIYEAGADPLKYNAKIDQDLQNGLISQEEAAKRKSVVARAQAAIESMPAMRDDGSALTDNEKAKYVTNAIALEDIKEQQKGASPSIKEDLVVQEDLINAEQQQIVTAPEPKLDLEKIQEEEKEELAQAKAQYKGYPAEFKKEQNEKIRKKYQDKIKLFKKQQEEIKKAQEQKEKEAIDAKEVAEKENQTQNEANSQPEIAEIKTEDEFSKELEKAIKETEPKQTESVEQNEAIETPIKSKGQRQKGIRKEKRKTKGANGLPLREGVPKLTAEYEASPVTKDVKKYANPLSVIDEVETNFKGDPLFQRTAAFLRPILEKNPQIHIDTEAEAEEGVLGSSYPGGRVTINFGLHQNQGALVATMLHELIHAVTRNEIETNPAFADELFDILEEVRKATGYTNEIIRTLARTQFQKADAYGTTNVYELVAEVFSNPEFYERLKGFQYKGQDLLTRIIERIIAFFSKKYKALQNIKNEVDTKEIAEYIMQIVERTITPDTQLEKAESSNNALPLAANVNAQKEAVQKIMSRSKNLADSSIVKMVVDATGIDQATAQQWLDEVRQIPPPPPPKKTIDQLSEESKNVSLNKFKNLFKKEFEKEPNWFKRNWESLKRGASTLDNPYYFVTKLTKDINKQYGNKGKEVIPLGRAFEKSAAGRASLRVDQFVQSVVNGKLGDKDLGRIKGKKLDDFQIYLAAKRIIDRFDTMEKKRSEGEDVNRRTGNITKQDAEVQLEALGKEYGPDEMKDFEARADAFQHQMQTMLDTLQESGILSEEQLKEINKDNEFYAPFSVVQSLMPEGQKSSTGIAGVVKRIKGIKYDLQKIEEGKPVEILNELANALDENIISAEDYFNAALDILNHAKNAGTISEVEFTKYVSGLENPGFQINGILDAAANMIYRAEGMALKNTMMQRLYAYKKMDTEGIYIQDVDYLQPMTLQNGETRMVSKPLNSIAVQPGMAPVQLKLDGKPVVVAVDKYVADKLNGLNNAETAGWMKWMNGFNKVFRAFVITLSPGFQVANVIIDFLRSSMLSRYGVLAGKGIVAPIANAVLYIPQYIEALGHTSLAAVGKKTDAYKQWMESDSFSQGAFDNLFDNEKRIKQINASSAKRILNKFLSLNFLEAPGTALEQTHKLVTHQRGMAVEGFKPEMFTAMLSSLFAEHIKDDMSQRDLSDAMDRLNYEVQNYAGSPNFPQTQGWLRVASIFLQFFSARVKGEMTDYRRVANLFAGKGEGVKLSGQERAQMLLQFGGISAAIVMYAFANNYKDEDEEEFDLIPSFHQDNSLNIPCGTFEYTDDSGESRILRDYIKIPMRGLTATINTVANKYVKWRKHNDPESFKQMGLAVVANASPVNLSGKDEHEYGESLVSNLTPVLKYFIEYSFNRDTHSHRDLISTNHRPNSVLDRYRRGDIDEPWAIANPRTAPWAISLSKFLKEELGITASAISIEHMEKTMGAPIDLIQAFPNADNLLKRRLLRSEMRYPVAGSTPGEKKEK